MNSFTQNTAFSTPTQTVKEIVQAIENREVYAAHGLGRTNSTTRHIMAQNEAICSNRLYKKPMYCRRDAVQDAVAMISYYSNVYLCRNCQDAWMSIKQVKSRESVVTHVENQERRGLW